MTINTLQITTVLINDHISDEEELRYVQLLAVSIISQTINYCLLQLTAYSTIATVYLSIYLLLSAQA